MVEELVPDAPSYCLLGTGGNFTYQVLKSLIESNCPPIAYVQYGAPQITQVLEIAHIPIETKLTIKPIFGLLKQHSVPVYYHSTPELSELIERIQADFMLVACWPVRIDQVTIQSVKRAAVNLHPSLLPAFRGYDPITDQIESNQQPFGVSLHMLSDQFDCGDIVMQEEVSTSFNDSKEAIETLCAQKGAQLFKRAIQTYDKPGWSLISQL